MRTIDWLLIAAGGVALYVLTRPQAKTLRPTGAGKLPDIMPPPVSGYEHDDEFVFDPDDPPPSEDDYDDRMPCATQLQYQEALLLGDGAACLLPGATEPVKKTDVPYAAIPNTTPRWPVRAGRQRDVRVSYQDVRGRWHGRWGRHFAAARKRKDGTGRYHAGIDLQGDVGDVVLAAEPGIVEAILPFTAGTWAIYVRSADGRMLNYGEVERGSWKPYGLQTGDEVKEGQPLALVGSQTGGGAHMLHFEIYGPSVTVEQIRKGQLQWSVGAPAPAPLLDPTRYLLAAQERWIADNPEIV